MTEEQEALDPNTGAARLQGLAQKSLTLAKLVAQNPAAPPELLYQFASTYDQDPTLLALVLSNPNTPKEALVRYGWSQPRALLQNPFFEILLLEDPLLLQSIPEPTLIALLSQSNAPIPLLEQNLSHPNANIQTRAFLALLSRIEVTSEFLERFARHQNPSIQSAVISHPNTPLPLLESLLAEFFDRWTTMAAIAKNPQATAEMLIQLSKHKHEMVLAVVAQNPKAPTDALTTIALSTNLGILRDIATHPNTNLETLERLSYEEDESLLYHIAKREQLTPIILQRLAGHPSHAIHRAILQNKGAQHLRRLFYRAGYEDAKYFAPPEEDIRSLSSPDRSLSIQELTELSRGMSFARSLVARHPNTPKELLAQLASDNATIVRIAIVHNPNTTEEILFSMRRDKEENIRISLAHHPNCSLTLFYALASDRSVDVKLSLASFAGTPQKVLKQMFEDTSDKKGHLKKAIARNAGLPLDWMKALAKYRDASLRQCIARNSSATEEILRMLSTDENDAVRAAVAHHPKLPNDVLDILLQDAATKVRDEALKNKNKRGA
jgi:hypothetical protein